MSEVRTEGEEASADRGIPSLDAPSTKGKRQANGIKMAIVVGIAILVVFGGIAILLRKIQTYRATARETTSQQIPAATRLKPLGQPAADEPPLPDSMKAPATASTVATGPAMTPGMQQATAQTGRGKGGAPQVSEADKRAAEAAARASRLAGSDPLAYGRQSESAGGGKAGPSTTTNDPVSQVAQALALQNAMNPKAAAQSSSATLESSMKPTESSGAAATVLQDPALTMTQGTLLTCALETALDSTVPGYTKCSLTEDVYSTDGRTVLAERGSTLIGQYESSSLKSGMNRIFLLWTRLETIHGVVVNLDSPAVDELGRSGVTGLIDNHFWQRFGAGLLLSVVDDLTASAANRSSTQQVQFSSTSGQGENAATIALQHSVDIPPTLTKNQGGLVKVFVARDLYFGNVYGFRTATR